MPEFNSNNMKKIAFIHPDLGIGGAERLVVDAAMGLQAMKNDITIFTSHCDKTHCFEEVRSEQLKVKVYGDFLPSHALKKLHIFFAILRQFYLTMKMIISGEIKQFDYFIVDQLSFSVPLISYFCKEDCRVLFYCHFPDQLLAKKGGLLKKIYRVPFDFIEEQTTGCSDKIVVNSNFTKAMFHNTFSNLSNIDPGVIYPCVDVESSELTEDDLKADEDITKFFNESKFFLSINRFEKKKDIELAIKAFAAFKKSVHSSTKIKLVVAGGFDSRVIENVQYLDELVKLSNSLGLKNFTIRGKLIIMPPSAEVIFLPSISSSIKKLLLKKAEMLLYTPSNEHFGIVPVEGMLFKTIVLSANNGGPLESIVHFDGSNQTEATGFTVEPDFKKWSEVMIKYFSEYDIDLKNKLIQNGYKRALSKFSRDEMSEAFYKNLIEASSSKKVKNLSLVFTLLQLIILLLGIIIYIVIY